LSFNIFNNDVKFQFVKACGGGRMDNALMDQKRAFLSGASKVIMFFLTLTFGSF
jgi:hypothetical protein